MSTTEQERVHQVMQDKARGDQTGRKFAWDPQSKKLRVVNNFGVPDGTLEVTRSDMDHFSEEERVRQIQAHKAHGDRVARTFAFIPDEKRVRIVDSRGVPDGALKITKSDMDHFATEG